MIVLGLDPGVATTGYGLVEKIGSKLVMLEYGVIQTKAKTELSKRLFIISEELKKIFSSHSPESVAVEQLLFNKNVSSAMMVAQARGVMLLSAEQNKLPVFTYSPPQIKLGICGYGRADKQQVQYMVKKLLNLDVVPKPDDAADALAIAVCHIHSARLAVTQS